MNKVKFLITLIVAKLIYTAIRLLKHSGGTSFVGMAVLRMCPDFLSYCNKYIKKNSITVTGTNGKTTTSGLISHILENENTVIHNEKGANMLTGVANMFALGIYPLKRFDYAVIESDEAYLTKLYDCYKADYLLVTNLFRDQLDRYGELSTTASFIQNAIDKNSDLHLILNADDPLVTNFGKNHEKVAYFGFEEVEYASEKGKNQSCAPSEVFNCICSEPLTYSKQFFAQEGHYFCSQCGYKRPEPDFKGYIKIFDNYSELKVVWENKTYDFIVNLVGLYNAYNVLGAISCAFLNGITYEVIKNAINSYKSIFGRAERRTINGHETLIQLIKNPTGASEVLKTVDLNSNIVIAINDNYADGRDISWLWDSDFEQLKNAQKLVITSGLRAHDTALRLKYAGIPQEKIIIEKDLRKAIELASSSDNNENITILPSYTALLKLNRILKNKEK